MEDPIPDPEALYVEGKLSHDVEAEAVSAFNFSIILTFLLVM